MDEAEVRRCVAEMRNERAALVSGHTAWVCRLTNLYANIAWLTLNYTSWVQFLAEELDFHDRIKIDAEVRRPVVAHLRKERGMTQQAIADALGVGQQTVADDVAALTGAGKSNHPATVVGKDGRERPARKGISPERDLARPKVAGYLRENPGAGRNETARATGVDRSMVSRVAHDIGHEWPQSGPPREAVTKGGKTKTPRSPLPPATEESLRIPHEMGYLVTVHNAVESLQSRNGRVIVAQFVTGALAAGRDDEVLSQMHRLAADVAYLESLLLGYTDSSIRDRRNTGVEDRDDVPEQRVSPARLHAV